MSTGVAITTYRRRDHLEHCLHAVAGLGDKISAVCVVDNDPSAEPFPRPDELPDQISYESIVSPSNIGLPAALALAFERLAGCDRILVLDDDTAVTPEVFSELEAALRPGTGVASVETFLGAQFNPPDDPSLFAWSPSLVRRAAIDAVGPPDGRLFFGYDDYDFGLRLREAGWAVAVAKVTIRERFAGTSWPERRYFGVRNTTWLATRRWRRRSLFWRLLAWELGRTIRALGGDVASGRVSGYHLRDAKGAAVGLVHGLIGRLGPPPPWVLARHSPPKRQGRV